eukprot:GEMP01083939.1.p1 GENE.GEMP01083939.1~~GEMP01083939.1.p1  ORF type:complete len:198 (+),score=64.11 GEMP01083939.1:62-655(+)
MQFLLCVVLGLVQEIVAITDVNVLGRKFQASPKLSVLNNDADEDNQGDSLIQTKAKAKWANKDEETQHFFNTVEGEDDSGEMFDDVNDKLDYDDAFIQVALQAHSEFYAATKETPLKKSLLQRRAPDDDEYDFAADDSDDPSDFSVGQFLESDDDDEKTKSFVQRVDPGDDGPDGDDDHDDHDDHDDEEDDHVNHTH